MNQTIRDIKLDRTLGVINEVDRKFQEIWDDIKVINCDVYNRDGQEYIYYNSNNKWIFYQDSKNGHFWCHYDRHWNVFALLNVGGYKDIQYFTKYMVEEALNKEVSIPVDNGDSWSSEVEGALNREVATPLRKSSSFIEAILNRDIPIPTYTAIQRHCLIDDVLNDNNKELKK